MAGCQQRNATLLLQNQLRKRDLRVFARHPNVGNTLPVKEKKKRSPFFRMSVFAIILEDCFLSPLRSRRLSWHE